MSDDIVLGRAGQFNVQVRDVTLSNHAGIVMIRSFADRLGVSEVLDNELSVKQRERGFTESESVMSLVTSMILGGSCLLDLNVLRGDQGTQMLMTSQKVALGTTQVPSPTTMGELLRKFDLGDIWDLHRVMQTLQGRVRLVQRQSLQGMDCCTVAHWTSTAVCMNKPQIKRRDHVGPTTVRSGITHCLRSGMRRVNW